MSGTYTPARARAIKKHLDENYENISVKVRRGERERYKQAAKARGLSLRAFVIDALDEYVKKEQV